MIEILENLLLSLDRGTPCVLSYAVERSGSVPTPAGSRLLVNSGSVLGTVGGGQVEAEIVLRSREILAGGASRLSDFSFDSEQVRQESMLCGGRVTIYSELFQPGRADRELLAAALERARSGEGAALVTTVIEGPSPAGAPVHLLLYPDGNRFGGLPVSAWEHPVVREARRFSDRPDPVYLTPEMIPESFPGLHGFFVEYLIPPPTVVVYGGGHVGQALSRSAAAAGFRVAVVDDRAEYARPERFPEADRVIHSRFEDAFERLVPGPGHYLVSVTRCHDQDREVIARAVKYPAAYIGMIGSRRKVKVLWEHLIGQGVDPAALEHVHAPVGLDIGAETPEEIAVSIVAQLIRVRRGRKPVIRRGTISLQLSDRGPR